MNRRRFVQYLLLAGVVNPVNLWAAIQHVDQGIKKKRVRPIGRVQGVADLPQPPGGFMNKVVSALDENIKDYLTKIRAPNKPHKGDIVLPAEQGELLQAVVERLQRVISKIGDGNFCVIGFAEALKCGKDNPEVGEFTKEEIAFIESIYYRNACDYGFFGKKQMGDLFQDIKKSDIYKVPQTGNYLFQGDSLTKYNLVKKNLGDDLILTSGIRGVVKQFYLFLYKAYRFQGNLSLASRSLAPPGYSYHATGDFDVGQKGLGGINFSEGFIKTPIYKQLTTQGYVEYRYGRDNLLGVRFEPWHIKL